MTAPLWIGATLFAVMAFVTCLLAVELFYLVTHTFFLRWERRIHALSDDRFAEGLANHIMLVLAIPLGIGSGRAVTTGPEGYSGFLIMLVALAMGIYYLDLVNARELPRRVGRARLRGMLADANKALDADPGLAGPAGAALRAEVERVGRIGHRLVARAEGLRWSTAIRRERRWLRAAIAVSAAVPIAAGAWVAVHRPPADDALAASLVLAGVLTALAGAVALRYTRYRRTLHDLGTELRARSDAILERFTHVGHPPSRGLRHTSARLLHMLACHLTESPPPHHPRSRDHDVPR